MPSLRTTLAAAASLFFASAGAELSIDPSSVPLTTRKEWCRQELSTCPLICQQTEPRTTLTNTCDPVTLQYGCLCGNNMQPNVSEYSVSLPYFICQAYVQQCQARCADNSCQANCSEQNKCGAQSPTKVNATAKASSTANDPTVIYTGSPGSSNAGKTGAGSIVDLERACGLVVILTGFCASFALL